jgi:hypothetical protein
MRFRKSTHAVYKTEYHIVRTPRYRRKLFVEWVKEYTDHLLHHLDELEEDIEVIKALYIKSVNAFLLEQCYNRYVVSTSYQGKESLL